MQLGGVVGTTEEQLRGIDHGSLVLYEANYSSYRAGRLMPLLVIASFRDDLVWLGRVLLRGLLQAGGVVDLRPGFHIPVLLVLGVLTCHRHLAAGLVLPDLDVAALVI